MCVTFDRVLSCFLLFIFFFNDTATTEIYTLSLHDALPIFLARLPHQRDRAGRRAPRLHLVLPVRRVREVPAPEGGGARVGRGLDRPLARAHGRGPRLAARPQRPLEGEAELLLPAPVLDLVRSRRALARGRDPAGRRAALLLGLRFPAPRSPTGVREGADRAGGA